MGRPYGVLLITGGRTHQENYAPGFANDPRCRLIGLTDERGLSDDRQKWNRELAEQLGIPFLEDLDAALARDDVDIVSVCSEPERRSAVACRAANAGKHLYMDKPLGGNLLHIDQLVEAIETSQVQSQMFTLVRSPWCQRARQLLEDGSLGDLVAIHADLLFAKGPAGTVPETTPRKEHYPPKRFTFVDSKREVFTTAIYSLAFVAWLTGRRIARVRGVTANYFFSEHVRNDVEDFGAMILSLDNGVTATITAGRIGWSSHPGGGPMQTLLVGAKGHAKVDAYEPRLEISNDRPPWQAPRRIPEDPMGFWSSTQALAEVRPKTDWEIISPQHSINDQSYFIDCLEKGVASDMPVSLAAHATEAVLAAYQSAAEDRWIDLPLDREPWQRLETTPTVEDQ